MCAERQNSSTYILKLKILIFVLQIKTSFERATCDFCRCHRGPISLKRSSRLKTNNPRVWSHAAGGGGGECGRGECGGAGECGSGGAGECGGGAGVMYVMYIMLCMPMIW